MPTTAPQHHHAQPSAATPSTALPTTSLLPAALALAAGLMWGASTSGLQTVLPYPWAALANAISPWVLPAFAAGALVRRPLPAVLAGFAICLGEVGGYYLLASARGFGVGTGEMVLWSATAVIGGPAFAAAGWLWRTAPHGRWRWPALGAAMPAGVLVAEGGYQYGAVLGYTSSAVLFCLLGAVALIALGATSTRQPGPSTRLAGLGATAAWLALILPAGIAGEMLLATISL